VASFFISHSSRDGAASERVRARLKGEGYESVFLDFDPEDGIPAGRDWEHELYAQLRRSDAVIFLCSAASVESKWCFAELALARATGKPIFPIALEPAARHPLLADTQSIEAVDLADDGEAAFDRLWHGLRQLGFDPRDAFAWDLNRPPFPGLSPLEAEDAAVYFGRDDKIEELLSRLQPILGSSGGGFIAVIGPSGSGKSSLVRAGVVPRLQRIGARWAVVPPLTPGHRPMEMLARRLAAALGRNDWRDLRDRLDRDPAELIRLTGDLLDKTAGDGASALLVIDQAEQLVTADADERASFFGVLRASLTEGSPLWVVATLRSEFVTSVLQETAFADVIGAPVLLGPLDRSRIPEVVEEPARRAGLELDPGLVGRVVEETRGGDALPLLAYTLRQLYDRAGPDRRITMKDYDAIGGVLGALRGRADAIADELGRSGRGELVIPTLLRFANVDQENEPIGRRVLRRNLSPDEDEVVRAFIEARLLVSDGAGEDAAVGVAHDSLLRSWGPLRQAIEAARDALRLRSELERLSQEWDSVGRSTSYLLREERLAVASSFLESEVGDGEVLPLVQEFVERSRQQSQAVLRRESELLAGRVLESLDEDPELGLLLALAAADEYFLSPRAIRALNEALVASKLRLHLRGHDGPVDNAAFSSDGSRIVTGSVDGTVRVWDAESGDELRVLRCHEGILSAALSTDGRQVATAYGDVTTGEGSAQIWDVESGTELHVLRGHDGIVWSAAFSPDGSRVVTASRDGTARIWDAMSGEELHVLRGHEGGVSSAAFSPSGELIVTGSNDGTARVWDAATADALDVLSGHEDAIQSAAFWSDTVVVTGSTDRTARIWEAESGELLALRGHEGTVWSAAFSRDGTRVVTGSEDESARVWEAESGEQLRVLYGGASTVACVAFSPDGSRVLTASRDGARVWDVADEALHVLSGHEGPVNGAAFSADGSKVATGSGNAVRVWDTESGEELLMLGGDGENVWSVAFSPDGRWVVSGSADGTARVWDAESGEQLRVLHGHEDAVESAAFSPDASRVVTSSDDGTARIWAADSGEELRLLRGHEDDVRSAAFSPDGSRIVTASDDGTARIWDADSGEELRVLRGDEDWVFSAAFSPDGSLVVTAGNDTPRGRTTPGTVRVWDATTGEEVLMLRGPEGQIRSAVFSPDGSRVVTGSGDGKTRGAAEIWDVESGEEIQVLRGHSAWVECAACSPDGRRVVTASGDGTARIWETLPVDLLVAKAKTRVTRGLTDAERAEYGLPSP
jgi:WD40 repeat protein